jgi:glutamine amidotransferase
MTSVIVGVVDYGMGNHASVVHSLRDMGFRVKVSCSVEELKATDILILPGVGAFPAAMSVLHERGLVTYLQMHAKKGLPLIGICLGMQLLASASHEFGITAGIDLIPGEIIPFPNNGIHIGWNTLEVAREQPLFSLSNGEAFYFNHSFYYQGSEEYRVASTQDQTKFSSVICRDNVYGIQFHPEKSQAAGKFLLKRLIQGLVND